MPYWFRPKRFWGCFAFYYPANTPGWIATLILSVIAVAIFLLIDRQAHSASDTLLQFALPAIVLMLLYDLLCFRVGEYPAWWRKKSNDNRKV